jgi:hypothetical protein
MGASAFSVEHESKNQASSDHGDVGLAGQPLPLLRDHVLVGIGSGDPGFNNYRPHELEFFIALTRDLKLRNVAERSVLTDYASFWQWIEAVPVEGNRQFRHMLRYFASPTKWRESPLIMTG